MRFTGDHFHHRDGWPIDDAAAEALLAGGEATPDLEPVAGVIRTLRESARRRVTPSARLAAWMASGRPGWPDRSSAPIGSGVRRGRHRAGRHGVVAGYALHPARLMAWAGAVGLAAAVIGTATAGFARVLPEPAQGRFETVVEVMTGFDLPEGREDGAERWSGHGPVDAGGDRADGKPDRMAPDRGGATEDSLRPGPRPEAGHGSATGLGGPADAADKVTGQGHEVREDARDRSADGDAVSSAARDSGGSATAPGQMDGESADEADESGDMVDESGDMVDESGDVAGESGGTDGESADGESANGESADGESTDGESADGESADGESAGVNGTGQTGSASAPQPPERSGGGPWRPAASDPAPDGVADGPAPGVPATTTSTG